MNRLANEPSPYLRQHKDNPVHWYPWGDDAFEAARERDVPVLLSVGYSACHWCHVMAHESFENPEIAAYMNEHFVCVKVDREERPDVDALYMEATQAMTGSGGWPMTVFMLATGEPFFCGTYFPPQSHDNHPGFPEIMSAIVDLWNGRRDDLVEQAQRITTALQRDVGSVDSPDNALPTTDTIAAAMEALMSSIDEQHGGFGGAPKFPQAMAVDQLLRAGQYGSQSALDAATLTLDHMASGGIYDHLGGGFSRYSVDRAWLVPHFEKMLYDNALLIRTYTHAYQITHDARYAQIVEETVEYVLRDLSGPNGARFAAEDADSLPHHDATKAEEGAFYVWSRNEVIEVLEQAGLSDHIDEVVSWYGITMHGNFEGANIPNRLHRVGHLERSDAVEAARVALLAHRATRPRPSLDDKVLTEWNALMISALCDAGEVFQRSDWIDAAVTTAEFLHANLHVTHENGTRRWYRSFQFNELIETSTLPTNLHSMNTAGVVNHLAYGNDYAALLEAFIDLYEATGDPRWLHDAQQTADDLIDLFGDPNGGFVENGRDGDQLIAAQKSWMDNPTPATNSLAAHGLLRLERHLSNPDYGKPARDILAIMSGATTRYSQSFGYLLAAVVRHVHGPLEIVIDGDATELLAAVRSAFLPTRILAHGEPTDSALWEGRVGTEAGYLCWDHVCQPPVTSPAEVTAHLSTVIGRELEPAQSSPPLR